jgi:hypothetical protein
MAARWRAPVTWSLGERACGVEYDATKAVVLVVGRKEVQNWKNSGDGVELRLVVAMAAFVGPARAQRG